MKPDFSRDVCIKYFCQFRQNFATMFVLKKLERWA